MACFLMWPMVAGLDDADLHPTNIIFQGSKKKSNFQSNFLSKQQKTLVEVLISSRLTKNFIVNFYSEHIKATVRISSLKNVYIRNFHGTQLNHIDF
jgi:hypothetical protein